MRSPDRNLKLVERKIVFTDAFDISTRTTGSIELLSNIYIYIRHFFTVRYLWRERYPLRSCPRHRRGSFPQIHQAGNDTRGSFHQLLREHHGTYHEDHLYPRHIEGVCVYMCVIFVTVFIYFYVSFLSALHHHCRSDIYLIVFPSLLFKN